MSDSPTSRRSTFAPMMMVVASFFVLRSGNRGIDAEAPCPSCGSTCRINLHAPLYDGATQCLCGKRFVIELDPEMRPRREL